MRLSNRGSNPTRAFAPRSSRHASLLLGRRPDPHDRVQPSVTVGPTQSAEWEAVRIPRESADAAEPWSGRRPSKKNALARWQARGRPVDSPDPGTGARDLNRAPSVHFSAGNPRGKMRRGTRVLRSGFQ